MVNTAGLSSDNDDGPRKVKLIDHMRKRPAMYLGSTDLQGLILYLYSAIELLVDAGAARIDLEFDGDKIQFTSDTAIKMELDQQQDLVHNFETHSSGSHGSGPGNRLCAFSSSLIIRATTGAKKLAFRMENGVRKEFEFSDSNGFPIGSLIRLRAEPEIFTTTKIPGYMIERSIQRLSYRIPKVQFRLTRNNNVTEFCSEDGLGEMFEALTSNSIVLHEPIRICGRRHDVGVELIFAFHGSKKSRTHLLARHDDGRKKGTPIKGLKRAMKKIRADLEISKKIGVFALLQIDAPDFVFQSQQRKRIRNLELPAIVEHVVVTEMQKWLDERPGIREQLKSLTPVSSMFWLK